MSRESIGNGMLALGTLLLGYTLATESAATGNIILNYGDPRLKFHWAMLGVSLTIIVVALVILFFKKDHEDTSLDLLQQNTAVATTPDPRDISGLLK